ncbi:MAG: flagellum-specific peptidoglycan hydrolase FlgJ, partial [Maribacter sp.]
EQKNIPVFRLLMVFLVFSFLYTKDFSFSFSMGNPLALASKIGLSGENGTAMSINEYAPVDASNLKEKSTEAYIKKYKDLAVTEMIQFGVPASITLGQAIIESRAGNSRLARENNNHFGVKCFSKKCAKGHCTNHKDDHHKDFFRSYESVWASYRNHSQFLQKDRYKNLKNYGKDYKKWARGLKKAGYATDRKYDKKLISVIERYKLNQYDK